MARLYISQDRIDRLAADNRIVVDGDRMDIPALGASFRIRPAVRFLRVVDGDDPPALVGRVKTEEQLRALGADLVANSVVLGETAYECENGFVGEGPEHGSGGDADPSARRGPSGAHWMGQLKQMPD